MAILLDPAEPDVRAAADSAREILTRLEAAPFLARLDAALAGPGDKPVAARGVAETASAVQAAPLAT
jgi:hypothetical protein